MTNTNRQEPIMKRHATSEPLPAGDYFVGDPCYAFEAQDMWMALLEDADYTNTEQRILEANAAGRSFTAAVTAYGDGVYTDQHDRVYGVDAGILGVVPVASADDEGASLYAMHRHTFATEFTVTYTDGTITIGDIIIDTASTSD